MNIPFSREYVIHTTVKHMRKSVDISIEKTFKRIEEFANDPVKSIEVLVTLSELNTLRNNLDNMINK